MLKLFFPFLTLSSILCYAGITSSEDVSHDISKVRDIPKENLISWLFDNTVEILIYVILLLFVYVIILSFRSHKINISFSVPYRSYVKITLLDKNRNEVLTILETELSNGKYNICLDKRDYPNGVFYYKITSEFNNIVRERILRLVVLQ